MGWNKREWGGKIGYWKQTDSVVITHIIEHNSHLGLTSLQTAVLNSTNNDE